MGFEPLPPHTLPPHMKELRDALDAAGFRLVHTEYYPKVFGNMVLDFQRGRLCVRFSRDRSEWWVYVSGPDCTTYYSPGTWESYLEGDLSNYYVPTLEERAAIVTARLADILAAAEGDPDLQAHLEDFESKRDRAWDERERRK